MLQVQNTSPQNSWLTVACVQTTPNQPPESPTKALAEMISLIEEGMISGKIAKDALPRLLAGDGNAGVRAFVEAEGLVQISGAGRRPCVRPASV
jgi:Asp-tRNA(Asn)/Glu-tRNA(Gln) amidotransferase B subunit